MFLTVGFSIDGQSSWSEEVCNEVWERLIFLQGNN